MTHRFDAINKSFERITRNLSRGSLNYGANFRLFPCRNDGSASLEGLVRATLGGRAELGGSSDASLNDVVDALNEALRFRGDDGSFPNLAYLDNPESNKDFDAVIAELRLVLEDSVQVVSFWLKKGHPFYPVYWDFAFFIELKEDSVLLVASSSD